VKGVLPALVGAPSPPPWCRRLLTSPHQRMRIICPVTVARQ
jgi:hypothetical protein